VAERCRKETGKDPRVETVDLQTLDRIRWAFMTGRSR
jgi:hypothetical protein